MWTALFRTVILYVFLITVIRLMGKRQIGQMEPSEFAVTMLAANLASIPIEEWDIPLLGGIVPLLTVLALEYGLSIAALRSIRLRKLLCGKPVILIENGQILQDNLRATRVTLDELTGHLREKDVLDLSQVQYAILETNGNLSVFPFPDYTPACAKDAGIPTSPQHLPITILSDGHLIRENLEKSGFDPLWLQKTLQKRKTTQADTWLLTVDGSGKVVWYPREKKK